MTQYKIYFASTQTTNPYIGCTVDLDDCTIDEIASFDTYGEALDALKQYKSYYNYKTMQYRRRLYDVEEYYIEEVEVDEDGEITDCIGVWLFAEPSGEYFVTNEYGKHFVYDHAVNLMDDELCDELHDELGICYNQEFFDAYCKAYFNKYGEEFELAKENPVW